MTTNTCNETIHKKKSQFHETQPKRANRQGAGSWFSIELPEPEVVSGVKLWFEDGDERVQTFTTIRVGEGKVSLGRSERTAVFVDFGDFTHEKYGK